MVNAANHLNVNASVVSKRLAKLERLLGIQLVRRTTRQLHITEAGQRFYEQTVAVSGLWQSAIDEASNLAEAPKGVITICAPQPVLCRFLLPLLSSFQARYPEVVLQLRHRQYEQLPDLDADVTVCREIEGYQSNSVVSRRLLQYRNQLFAAPSYLTSQGSPEALEALMGHRVLVYKADHQTHWHFEQGGVCVRPSMLTNNTETIICAAVAGMGIAYVPKLIVSNELESGALLPVLPELCSRPWGTYAYFSHTRYVSQNVRLLVDHLVEGCEQI